MTPTEERLPPVPKAAVLALIVAVVLVFANGALAPFLFDDDGSIALNPSVHHLGLGIFHSQAKPGETADGRPLLNASLAVSYAMGHGAPWAFHLGNVAIHAAACLALYGLLRRLLRRGGPALLREKADACAFVIALLWALHPLQTESVTYIVQRAESLAGLLYLLTLYAFMRSVEAPSWRRVSVLCAGLGMASKETVATVPVMVLLLDAWFVAGSVKAALRARRGYYAALAATWVILLLCIATTGWNRGGTIGLNVRTAWWAYAATQARAVLLYLKLSVWPQPLIFDYGTQWMHSFLEFAPWGIGVLGLIAAAVIGWRRRAAWAFPLVWFLLILAPSSSVIPGTRQTMAEHRMYLPLAGIVAIVVGFLVQRLGRFAWPVLAVFGIMLATGAALRNMDYHSRVALYADNVAKLPSNAYALNNYGDALFRAGLISEAKREFERALEVNPDYAEARGNLGATDLKLGKPELAVRELEHSYAEKSKMPQLQANLGDAYMALGRTHEATLALRKAVRQDPDVPEEHFNLANALAKDGQLDAAIVEYEEGIRLAPDRPQFQNNFGAALARAGRTKDAIVAFRKAVSLAPDNPGILVNLGNTYADAGRWADAAEAYASAVRQDPESLAIRSLLRKAQANAAAGK